MKLRQVCILGIVASGIALLKDFILTLSHHLLILTSGELMWEILRFAIIIFSVVTLTIYLWKKNLTVAFAFSLFHIITLIWYHYYKSTINYDMLNDWHTRGHLNILFIESIIFNIVLIFSTLKKQKLLALFGALSLLTVIIFLSRFKIEPPFLTLYRYLSISPVIFLIINYVLELKQLKLLGDSNLDMERDVIDYEIS